MYVGSNFEKLGSLHILNYGGRVQRIREMELRLERSTVIRYKEEVVEIPLGEDKVRKVLQCGINF